MKKEIGKRIEAIELKSPDWTAHLEIIDGRVFGWLSVSRCRMGRVIF